MKKINEISFKNKVDDAVQLSYLGQKRRNGDPYIVHPIRVKNRMGGKVGNNYTDEELVALFHDSIENANTTKKKSRILEKIKDIFKHRPDVVDAIVYLTRDQDDYLKYMKHIFIDKLPNQRAQTIAKSVKINDIIDNVSDNPHKAQYLKYKNAINILVKMGVEFPEKLINLFNRDLYLEYIISEAEPPKDTAASDAGNDASDTGGDDASAAPDAGGDNTTPDTGGADAGAVPDAGGNPFGDTGGDVMSGNPFGDVGGAGGGMGGDAMGGGLGGNAGAAPGGDASQGGNQPSEEEKKKILYYSDKLKKIKTLKDQRNVEEPGMDFAHFNDFIKSNYISMTKKGSIMLPASDDISKSKLFLDKVIVPYVKKYVDNYQKNNKQYTVLTNLNDNVIKYINSKAGVNLKATNWSNQYSDAIFKDVQKKTESKESAIKAAMYLYNITNGKKLKREGGEIDDYLNKWGVGPTASQKDILKVLYPEQYNQVQNEASFIVKVYLSSLRKEFMKQILHNEIKGLRTIALVDKYTAWMLNLTFKNSDKIIKDTKEKETKEQPKEAEGNNKSNKKEGENPFSQGNTESAEEENQENNKEGNAENGGGEEGNEKEKKSGEKKEVKKKSETEKSSKQKNVKKKEYSNKENAKIPNPFAP